MRAGVRWVYPATHRRCTDGHRSGPGWADNAEQSAAARLLYPANVDLILILIVALINWVEGVLNFTYVESIWECVENSLLFVPNQALYQAEPQPEMEYYFRVRDGRATYFAYFSADSKEIESVVRGPVFETIEVCALGSVSSLAFPLTSL